MSTHVITFNEIQKITRKRRVKIELKHCPFCGGEAEFRTGGNWNPRLGRRMGTGVRCKECKVASPTREGADSQLRIVEQWNRRVSE
jgi:hypothetical protein